MTLKKLEGVFASPLFLATAILFSVSFAVGLAVRDFDVISLLLVIGMWLAYAAAKGGRLSENQTGIKMISGCIKAQFIITWVLIGIIIVSSILLMVLGPAVIDSMDDVTVDGGSSLVRYIDKFSAGDEGFDIRISGVKSQDLANALSEILDTLGEYSVLIFSIIGICMLICVVIVILVNMFYTRNLHKLTKSVCVSFETGTVSLEKIRTVKIWMTVLAVFSGLGMVNSMLLLPVAALSSGCNCAAMVLVVIMLSRLEEEDDRQISEESEASNASDMPDQL